jgi:hypothetical protein
VIEPTRDAILDAARKACAMEGPKKVFLDALSRKDSPTDREIRSAWYALAFYRTALEQQGVDVEHLVPPADDGVLDGKAPVEAVLDASSKSIIIVRNWSEQQITQLRRWLGMSYLWSALIISLKPAQSIEMLTEEQMASAGWVRASARAKTVKEPIHEPS